MRRLFTLGAVSGQKFDVAASAKGVAGPSEDADIDMGIEPDVAPARAKLDIGEAVQCVAHLGPIDGDVRHVSLLLIFDEFEICRRGGAIVLSLRLGHCAVFRRVGDRG